MTITLTNKAMEREADSLTIQYTIEEQVAPPPALGGTVAESEGESFRGVVTGLVHVTKDEMGELMTREIESEEGTIAELRRARRGLSHGQSFTQEDIEQD